MISMKKILLLLVAAVPFLSAVSCGDSGSKNLLPNISGKAGEVLVVLDKSVWEGNVGTILRDSLCADCPFLPMKEPLYTLVNVTPSNFTQMFQIHRNIIMFNIKSDVVQKGVVIKKDNWAKPQIVILVNAASADEAEEVLLAGMHTILLSLEQMERDRIIYNTRLYQERKLSDAVADFTGGGRMVFPSGYSLKKKTADFMWISYETTYVQQGFFLYKYDASDPSAQLLGPNLINRRNSVLKDNVPGMVDGSYMTTSDILTPSVKYMSYKGRKFAELRGFWDVYGDFMGGPFVSHSFFSEDGSTVYCIEAYVYAPKYDKRHYVRQVESLLYSFNWEDNAK